MEGWRGGFGVSHPSIWVGSGPGKGFERSVCVWVILGEDVDTTKKKNESKISLITKTEM